MYELFFQEEAEKDLEKLDTKVSKRVLKKLRWLAENFDDADKEALTGNLAGLFKLRVGDYRVIYEVVEKKTAIVVHFAGRRREVYKRT